MLNENRYVMSMLTRRLGFDSGLKEFRRDNTFSKVNPGQRSEVPWRHLSNPRNLCETWEPGILHHVAKGE